MYIDFARIREQLLRLDGIKTGNAIKLSLSTRGRHPAARLRVADTLITCARHCEMKLRICCVVVFSTFTVWGGGGEASV